MTQANTPQSNLRQLAKQWQLGAIAYRFYYAPQGFLLKCVRQGAINMAIDFYAQQQMEAAAFRLQPVLHPEQNDAIEIHFLTGKKFWYQTCWCAYSMAQHSNLAIRPVIYDDGSLEQSYQDEIHRIFPNAKIFLKPELDARVNQYLPQHRFPFLRERRQNYPNLRKLIDIHIGSQGWKLVLDSDMLFFRTPTVLLHWLQQPQQPCYMVDTETSYGYTESLMTSLTQAPIPQRVNVGICGLKSDDLDWEKLESWCKTLIEQQGTHYYQEQALIAMLMAGQSCTVAPEADYVVMPDRHEAMQPTTVLHHYVADSKPWYFRFAWKHILQSNPDSLSQLTK